MPLLRRLFGLVVRSLGLHTGGPRWLLKCMGGGLRVEGWWRLNLWGYRLTQAGHFISGLLYPSTCCRKEKLLQNMHLLIKGAFWLLLNPRPGKEMFVFLIPEYS